MKILWAKSDFLHPTDRGGRIRTLEILKRLHRRHEVHYVAYDSPSTSEGRERAGEYSSRSFPVIRPIPPRGSAHFFAQLAANLLSPLPLAVARYRSRAMRGAIERLVAQHRYDLLVADFLSITPNFADLSACVLFQHNVETSIWKRQATHHPSRLRRIYFRSQARRMERYERAVCRSVRQVIAVSPSDTATMQQWFGLTNVADVPTGVDVEFFQRPQCRLPTCDMVFVGSMDSLPNIDGACWFMREVYPLIRARRPETTITFVGRNPVPEIRGYAKSRGVFVTGTVQDVRPSFWGATVSIVPLRIGGGTRLKIYEAMAAGIPVVSTTVGAEGLAVTHRQDICLADDPENFARGVLELLTDPIEWSHRTESALTLIRHRVSWDSAVDRFEEILESVRAR